ncbi:MAG TPA: hypothetical protein VFJ16_00590 [Longimicrobium sp.]|nr:hypothetical protein [Longimicrobium sp.]
MNLHISLRTGRATRLLWAAAIIAAAIAPPRAGAQVDTARATPAAPAAPDPLIPVAASGSTARDQQPAGGIPAYKLVLDYDVPESPAFVALDVSPEKVLTGSAAKPVAINFLSQVAAGGKVQAGLALDFSPYFLAGGRFENINEYRSNRLKRLLANTNVSFATVQDPTDSASLRFGAGVRLTLFDDHDPLQNAEVTQAVENLLVPQGPLGPRPRNGPVITKSVPIKGLAEAYAAAVDEVRRKPGRALAVGWGVAGTLRNAVLSADSVTRTRHSFWGGYRETFRGSVEFLGAVLVGGAAGGDQEYRLGGALRVTGERMRLTGEAVYESSTGQIHPGGVAEFNVLPQISAVASLGSEPSDDGADVGKLRFRTMLRWNMSQSGPR